MTMKRSKTLIAFLIFLAGMTSTTSFAYDIVVPNEDGIAIYYSWTSDNKTGLAVNRVKDDCSEVESGRLIIPANVSYQGKVYPVTSIGSWALAYCNMKSIVIPNSINTIGNDAFFKCVELTDVIIPNSVTAIGDKAFNYCENLTSVTMSECVSSIGQWAFAQCYKLTSMTIPESVSFVGQYAFQDDHNLTSVKIYCKEIGSWFASLPIQEVIIGNKVKTIGKLAFFRSYSLKNIIIPASVTSIGDRAFESCMNLTDVTIPKSVKEIGREAFNRCNNLKKVVIEGNPIIKEDAFYYDGFGNLDTIFLKSQTPPKMIFNPDYYVLSNGYPFTEYAFENAVLFIPEGSYDVYAASGTWSRFKNICTFSDNEYESDFENDSIYYTFQEDGVYVAAKIAKRQINYNGDGPLTPRDPQAGGQQPRIQTRGDDALDYTSYRGNIVIPESVSVYDTVFAVTGINRLAFQGCNELESVTIPQSVKQIGYAGFAECTGLTEITIPAGVELIDQYAFAYCTGLKRVIIEGNPVIDESAFIGCDTELEVIYTVVETHKAVDPDSAEDGAIHYGIDGRMIQPDTPGLHLIKRRDGTVVKALVRWDK